MEDSQITYSQELHWRLVAKWNEISFKKFLKMEGPEMSRLVAAYETAMLMDTVRLAHPIRKPKKRGHSGS